MAGSTSPASPLREGWRSRPVKSGKALLFELCAIQQQDARAVLLLGDITRSSVISLPCVPRLALTSTLCRRVMWPPQAGVAISRKSSTNDGTRTLATDWVSLVLVKIYVGRWDERTPIKDRGGLWPVHDETPSAERGVAIARSPGHLGGNASQVKFVERVAKQQPARCEAELSIRAAQTLGVTRLNLYTAELVDGPSRKPRLRATGAMWATALGTLERVAHPGKTG